MILPINRDVPIKTYLHHVYPLSVVLADKDYYTWLYNNYIQLIYNEAGGIKLNFLTNTEFVTWENIVSYSIDKIMTDINNIDIIEFLKNSINLGYYIQVDIDEFYLPNRKAYNSYNTNHELFIYGYDDGKSFFYTSGYNGNMIFSFDEIKYADFYNSFYNYKSLCYYKDSSIIVLFKLNSDYYLHTDIFLISELIYDYLNSVDTSARFSYYRIPEKMLNGEPMDSDKIVFGLDVYEKIIKHTLTEADHDVRIYQILMEHKKVMHMRIKYILNKYNITDKYNLCNDYGGIVYSAEIICNLILKYNNNKDRNILDRIADLLRTIMEKEKILLTVFYSIVESVKIF